MIPIVNHALPVPVQPKAAIKKLSAPVKKQAATVPVQPARPVMAAGIRVSSYGAQSLSQPVAKRMGEVSMTPGATWSTVGGYVAERQQSGEIEYYTQEDWRGRVREMEGMQKATNKVPAETKAKVAEVLASPEYHSATRQAKSVAKKRPKQLGREMYDTIQAVDKEIAKKAGGRSTPAWETAKGIFSSPVKAAKWIKQNPEKAANAALAVTIIGTAVAGSYAIGGLMQAFGKTIPMKVRHAGAAFLGLAALDAVLSKVARGEADEMHQVPRVGVGDIASHLKGVHTAISANDPTPDEIGAIEDENIRRTEEKKGRPQLPYPKKDLGSEIKSFRGVDVGKVSPESRSSGDVSSVTGSFQTIQSKLKAAQTAVQEDKRSSKKIESQKKYADDIKTGHLFNNPDWHQSIMQRKHQFTGLLLGETDGKEVGKDAIAGAWKDLYKAVASIVKPVYYKDDTIEIDHEEIIRVMDHYMGDIENSSLSAKEVVLVYEKLVDLIESGDITRNNADVAMTALIDPERLHKKSLSLVQRMGRYEYRYEKPKDLAGWEKTETGWRRKKSGWKRAATAGTVLAGAGALTYAAKKNPAALKKVAEKAKPYVKKARAAVDRFTGKDKVRQLEQEVKKLKKRKKPKNTKKPEMREVGLESGASLRNPEWVHSERFLSLADQQCWTINGQKVMP